MALRKQTDDDEGQTPTPSVVVLGDAAVGKTALVWALTGRGFGREMPPVGGGFRRTTFGGRRGPFREGWIAAR